MSPAQRSGQHTVTTDAELEALIGSPDELVKMKLLTEIDDTAREFIERSPFVVVATCDADDRVDASPKGDPPGFVHVIDSKTLAIPERKRERARLRASKHSGHWPHRADLHGPGAARDLSGQRKLPI